MVDFTVGELEVEATTTRTASPRSQCLVDQPYGSHALQVSFAGADSSELQFTAPGDVSGVKTDPGMRQEALPTGETMISIDYHDPWRATSGRARCDLDGVLS